MHADARPGRSRIEMDCHDGEKLNITDICRICNLQDTMGKLDIGNVNAERPYRFQIGVFMAVAGSKFCRSIKMTLTVWLKKPWSA